VQALGQCDHRKEESIRDLPELRGRHEGTQGAHLPQEAKMVVSAVQAGPNAGAKATLAADGPKPRCGKPLGSKNKPKMPNWTRRGSRFSLLARLVTIPHQRRTQRANLLGVLLLT
jgi:hypothetical protein